MEYTKIRPENYITVQGFMVTELKLKGTELLLFALLYGFTQDGETEFNGSLRYMCEWTNSSKPTVTAALKSLIEKGYIIKRQEITNGVMFNHYKISLGVVKKLYWGSKETLLGGGKKTLPNNNNTDNTKYNNTKEINKESNIKSEFEELWKLYPRKLGKDKALIAYTKARKANTPKSEIEDGLKRYLAYISTNKVDTKYIKHGATWFNQKCWEDEYAEAASYSVPESAYDISKW